MFLFNRFPVWDLRAVPGQMTTPAIEYWKQLGTQVHGGSVRTTGNPPNQRIRGSKPKVGKVVVEPSSPPVTKESETLFCKVLQLLGRDPDETVTFNE